jgi:hypothetical protein
MLARPGAADVLDVTIQLWDETLPGSRSSAGTLDLAAKSLTVRQLLRSRIRHEVERYNESLPEIYQGLVQPEETERILNGYRMQTRRRLDWEAQFRQACYSFRSNGFLVLVDDRQVTELDEPFDLHDESCVSFVKLVPLVGG